MSYLRWFIVLAMFGISLLFAIDFVRSFWGARGIEYRYDAEPGYDNSSYSVEAVAARGRYCIVVETASFGDEEARLSRLDGNGVPITSRPPKRVFLYQLNPPEARNPYNSKVFGQPSIGNGFGLHIGEFHDQDFGKRDWKYRTLAIPHWIIVLSFALVGWRLSRRIRHRRRAFRRMHAGQCVHCGYDLRRSSERCPECGYSGVTPTTQGNHAAPIKGKDNDF